MTAFSLLSAARQHLLVELMFFVTLGQLALCIYQQICRASYKRRILDGALFAALLCLNTYLLAVSSRRYPAAFPWILLLLASAFVFIHAVMGIRREYRISRQRLSPSSIKQTLDNLNSGILFADDKGRVILVNYRMGKLAVALTGSYPQMLCDIHEALDQTDCVAERISNAPALYRFPDGRIWRFRTAPLTEPELAGFTQTTAQDVTELYHANIQLEQENAALRITINKVRLMLDRVADRVREQETLSLKMRVHNEIGTSLIALSELMNGGDADAQLHVLQKAVSLFAGGNPTLPGTLEDVRQEAVEMRVRLVVEGMIPRDEEVESLIAAAVRECVTNCVRHARGSVVMIRITEQAALFTVTITNDGEPPTAPIVEGGGLSSLRNSVEEAGGEMYLSHAPHFALILNLKGGRPEL